MILLIPAYEPGEQLIELIKKIQKIDNCQVNILIVDDGSGNKYHKIFSEAEKLGCKVLTHSINKGKGRALKTGFTYLLKINNTEDIVCADCDGQHLPADIINVAQQVKEHRNCIVLGSRKFIGAVPLRSRFGNTVTRKIFSFLTGMKIYDTQSGLRGYSADMLPWLCNVSGERFEYEMNMLLEAYRSGYGIYEIEIDTVYHHNNESSHFHTIKDSLRVYRPILKFCGTSIISGILDFVLVLLLGSTSQNLLFSVVTARACSSLFNYVLNKNFVFAHDRKPAITYSLTKYYSVVVVVLLCNYTLIHIFNKNLGIPLFYAKLMTEAILFMFSYWSQQVFVFKSFSKMY